MDGGSSGVKWLVGTLIALLAAGGGIVALLNYIRPPSPSPGAGISSHSTPATDNGSTRTKPTPTPRVCTIEGAVYNDDVDTKPGIPNVTINYVPKQQNASVFLTTTDPHGQFKGNCSHIGSDEFPLALELSSPHWQGIKSKTQEHVLESGKDNINIYVSLKDISNGTIRSTINRTRINPRSVLTR